MASADLERHVDEELLYGWRYVQSAGANGKPTYTKQMLTQEDVLHPQEGDYIVQGSAHEADVRYFSDVFHAREYRLDHGLMLADCRIDWGISGLGCHCADISVFEGLHERPAGSIVTFNVQPSGGHCSCIIEVVSPTYPATRANDVVAKLDEYHRANVPLYVIIDQKKQGGPREILAYQNTPGGYVPLPLDSRGRILVPSVGIRIGLKDNRVVCYDADTDEEIGDYAQIERDLAAAKEAQETAERARLAAELARQASDQEATAHAQARLAAQQEAIRQTQACQAAEEARRAADEARLAAEQRALREAQARQAAEQRIRDLEELLRSGS